MGKFLKFLLFLLILGAICFGSYLAFKYYVYGQFYQPLPTIEKGSSLDKIKTQHDASIFNPNGDASNRPYSVLLMGLDDDTTMNSGHTDALIVALVDPKNKKVSLLSIPRDSYVPVAGKDISDKITNVHNDGDNATIMTVEGLLNIKIDYYTKINFNGFQSLINTIGGVDINVEENMTFFDRITNQEFSLLKGEQHLNGIQALNYARFRYDAQGDFGRNLRQQQVIKSIIDDTLNIRNVTKISQILNDLGSNVKTDVDFDVLTKTLTEMGNLTSQNIYTIPIQATPFGLNGISYVKIDDNSLASVKSYIKAVLNGENPSPLH